MIRQEVLTKWLKSIGADTRAGLVQYILVALILAMGGLSALYNKTRDVSIQILTTPTPLWATILLVLLGYLYIRIRVRKCIASDIPSLAPSTLDEPKIKILLKLYSRKKLTTEDLSKSLGLQLQTVAYHLVDLAKFGMVNEQRFSEQIPETPFDLPSLRRYYAWTIMQPGRKYLLDNKLVEA